MIGRNVKLVFLTNALFLLCSVITSLLSAWALGAEGRGELVVITIWAYIASLFAGFGLPYAHRYWAAREPDWNSEIFTFSLIFSIIVGGAAILIGEAIVPHLIGERSPRVVWLTRIFLLNVPVSMLLEMMRGILEGAREFGWLGWARMSFIGSQAAGYFVLWACGFLTVETALIVITLAQLAGLALMFAAVLRKLRPRLRWSFRVLKDELNYGLRSYPGVVTEVTVMRLDQMMLTGMASSTVIGLYTVAVALAEITATLASSVADALMPEVAAAENKEKSAVLLGKSLRLTLYAHCLVLIPLWFGAPYILTLVYGAEFGAAVWTLRVLLVASVVLSAALIVISGLNGFGRPGLSTFARLASAATTIIALFVLLPIWGMMGAALASLVGYAVMLIVALVSLRQTRRADFWQSLRPRKQDFSLAKFKKIFRSIPKPTEAGASS